MFWGGTGELADGDAEGHRNDQAPEIGVDAQNVDASSAEHGGGKEARGGAKAADHCGQRALPGHVFPKNAQQGGEQERSGEPAGAKDN